MHIRIPSIFFSSANSRITFSIYAFFFGTALLLTGCGATGPQYTAWKPSRPTASMLYVYRPSGFVNGAISPGISVDGKEYAALPNGGYMAFELDAGSYTVDLVLSDRYTGNSSTKVQLLPQVATYLRVETSIGDNKRLFSLYKPPIPRAEEEIKACKFQDANGPRFSKSYFWSDN